MVFRESARVEGPTRRLTARGRITTDFVSPVLLTLFGVGLACGSLGSTHTHCERRSGALVCEVERTMLGVRKRTVVAPVADVRATAGSPKGRSSRLTLVDVRGAETDVFFGTLAEARALSERLEQLPDGANVDVANDPPRLLWVAALAALIFGAMRVARVLRELAWWRITVDPADDALTVERCILGIPREAKRFANGEARTMEVELGVLRDGWTNTRARGPAPTVRLFVVTRDGARHALTATPQRGGAEVLRSIARVCEWLGDEDGALGLRARADASDSTRRGGDTESLRKVARPRLVSLMIVVAIIGIAAAIIVPRIVGSQGGTLNLVCEQRCRFDGLECLPGGRSTQTLSPGTYAVDVWRASPSPHWEPTRVEVRASEDTTFVCR